MQKKRFQSISLMFAIQRNDCDKFDVADIDPEYSKILKIAKNKK